MAEANVVRMTGSGRAADLLSVIPGGRRAGPVEIRTAIIIVVALGFIIGIRRGFKSILVKGG